MKHIILGYFLCIISCSAYAMKRPAQNNSLNLATPTYQNMEPTLKRIKLASPEQFTVPTIFTPAEQQNRIIVTHLNNALMHIGNAQEAVKSSNNELELRISQMHKEVAHAQYFVSLLAKYEVHIDALFTQMQRVRNYAAHYLENTKENVVDTTFSIAFNSQTTSRITKLLPETVSTLIDVEKSDESIIEEETPIEAEAVYTATAIGRKSPRVKSKKRPLQVIDVER